MIKESEARALKMHGEQKNTRIIKNVVASPAMKRKASAEQHTKNMSQFFLEMDEACLSNKKDFVLYREE